ncbi:MAG: VOC family protein [Solirubrobacteraceae bacterium]
MSQRETYPAGVPCWVDTLQDDPAATRGFYERVLGWRFDGDDSYAVARLHGADVAGVGARPGGAPDPAWLTHVRVDDVDAAAQRAAELGATVEVEPLDASPAGRVAAIRDPAGAVVCLWEAAWREGAERVNEPGAWAMSALQTPDTDAAARFYGDLFGWETESFGPATMFRLPGYVGGEPEQPVPRDVVAVMLPGEAAAWSVDFWIADLEAAIAAAEAAGGRVVVPPHDQPPVFRSAVLADPEGATFSLSQKG